MRITLTACGLGLLTILGAGAFATMNASATVNGHFINDASNGHATIVGAENYGTTHVTEFYRTEPTGTFTGPGYICTQVTYYGTTTAATTDTINVTPTYTGCATTSGKWGEVSVATNGCTYIP